MISAIHEIFWFVISLRLLLFASLSSRLNFSFNSVSFTIISLTRDPSPSCSSVFDFSPSMFDLDFLATLWYFVRGCGVVIDLVSVVHLTFNLEVWLTYLSDYDVFDNYCIRDWVSRKGGQRIFNELPYPVWWKTMISHQSNWICGLWCIKASVSHLEGLCGSSCVQERNKRTIEIPSSLIDIC